MLRRIISISGRPGLYKLINQGKNMLIVEQLLTGKRLPAYARDKVMSLGDISIYTNDGGDTPLSEVLETIRVKNDGKQVDIKAIGNEADLRKYFATIMPEYDPDRVYGSDIKKILQWYDVLIESGFDTFVAPEEESAESAENARADNADSVPEKAEKAEKTEKPKKETKATATKQKSAKTKAADGAK